MFLGAIFFRAGSWAIRFADGDALGHTVDEENGSKREADDDTFGQIAKDDDGKGGEQHHGIAA